MITMNERKMFIKSMPQIHLKALPNERDTRKAISNLVFEDVYLIPLESNNVYKRVYNVESLSDREKVQLNKYIDKEMKSAIKLIRRIRKLSKFMTEEQIRKLQGELL